MNTLRIGQRAVALGQPTLVIAEIGVNHDGSVQRAVELARLACDCGADAVKLQIFHADTLMHGSAWFAAYQKEQCDDQDPAAMLRRYELSSPDLRRVIDVIREQGMLPLATPFSLPDVDVVEQLGLGAVKIASPDVVNLPLLQRAAHSGKPLLISTGAATMGEIDTTVRWLQGWGASFSLLHCVSSYPTPVEQANLCWIGELMQRFQVPVGFSDHTTQASTGALAVAAGAVVIEKHLTYDRNAAGPDHAASADPEQFAEYVKLIRQADQARGKPGKHVLAIERDVREVSRQSLVVCRDLQPGQTLTETDLTAQRPGTGIPAGQILAAVGRKVKRPVKAGALLQWDMLHAA